MGVSDGPKGVRKSTKCFIDLAVYSKSRCFRLVGSSKAGATARTAVLQPNLTFCRRLGLRGDIAAIMKQCLVVPDLAPGVEVRTIEWPEHSLETTPAVASE